MNLGVGVYYDDNGKVPVLECVKRAEAERAPLGAVDGREEPPHVPDRRVAAVVLRQREDGEHVAAGRAEPKERPLHGEQDARLERALRLELEAPLLAGHHRDAVRPGARVRAGLGADELAAVREYEVGHRNRRTILGKIDQLTAS